MRRRRNAVVRLAVTLALVLGAAVFLLKIHPLYDAIHKGLDLQGGIEVLYQASGTADQPLTANALQRTVQVLSLRVNKLGVSEPVIQAEPTRNRILVQLAGVQNPRQALKILGTTAKLEFKSSKGTVIVTGSDLQHASAQVDTTQTPPNVVAVQFNAVGQKKLAQWTAKNVGKPMGIYLDGKLLEAPTIQRGCCPSGSAVITGSQTFQAAQNFAIELNSGALPLNLRIISENSVSSTLGQSSVRASMMAAVVALVLVVAFMFLVYRIPGFWADMALLVYALALMGVLVGINATLTLPGITGMILSIGMAVDSNVIIYERIREELRAGRSLRSSVDLGFQHGLRAILDSNTTTIIAAVVLYYLGSGLIRGFAVTVGIGVLISLLTAVVFTRYLLRWLVEAGSKPSWWFFAPRAVLAGGPGSVVGAPVALGAGFGDLGERRPAAASSRRHTLSAVRRDWQPDIPVNGAAGVPTAAGPAATPLEDPLPPVEAAPPGAPGGLGAAPSAGSREGAPGGPEEATRPHRSGPMTGKRRGRRGGRGGR